MPRRRCAGTHINATAAAVLGAAALAGALAVPASAAVNGSHVIAPLYTTSGLELSGYGANKVLSVTASRNGATLSTATATTDGAGDAAVNGGGADCWAGSTPGLLPGDTITVAGDGVPDSMLVQNVTAGRPELALNGVDILVHGTAEDLVTHGQVPVSQIESRIKSGGPLFANGKNVLRAGVGADGVLAYDSATATTWTATYSGLSAADRDIALNALDSRGVAVPIANEVTISQNPGAPGPQAPCTAPLSATALGGVTPSVVNLANSPASLTVSGPASADITDVSVTAGAGAAHHVTPSGGTWTVVIPAAEIAALPEGSSTVTASFTGTTAPTPQTRTILKDTIAPAAPTATPAPGTYATSQSVTIAGEPGSTIHYTNNGGTPTAGSPTASGAIAVTATQTLRALAVDAAGNPGAIGSFAYTISPPAAPVAPAGGGGVGGGAPGTTIINQTIVGPGSVAADPAVNAITGTSRPALALRQLGLAPVVKQRRAQKRGLRLSVRVPAGAAVIKVNVYRKTRRGLKLLSSGFRVAPTSAGASHVAQNQPALRRRLTRGSYQVQVTPGYSRSELGKTSKASFKIV